MNVQPTYNPRTSNSVKHSHVQPSAFRPGTAFRTTPYKPKYETDVSLDGCSRVLRYNPPYNPMDSSYNNEINKLKSGVRWTGFVNLKIMFI